MRNFWKKTTILSVILISIMMWTVRVCAQDTLITITASQGQTVNYTICDQPYTQAIMYKPSWALSGISFYSYDGYGEFFQDSIIITNVNDGLWYMFSSQGTVEIYINFVSLPTEHPSMSQDTSFCSASFSLTLNAGNSYASYQWSTGATTQTITATTSGTYAVTITNACGIGVYDKIITQANPNAPHLGLDQTFCWGSNSILEPGSTNVSSYQWSTGETTSTITVDTTGSYWVYLIDNNGCSGRDTVEITALVPISEEICYVEFDTITWKNNINWTDNLPGNADSIKIYKETSLDVWTPIGIVSKTSTHFLDIGSAPQSQSYSYKIALLDTCGNESAMSSYHTTITLLSAYDQPSNTYGFTWSAYYGLTVNDYYLFGIDANNNVTQIATVPGNVYMYNYLNPNSIFIKYFVGFEAPNCTNARTQSFIKSNWVERDPTITGIFQYVPQDFVVYPNPATEHINITLDHEQFQVEVSTILGQVLLAEHNTKILDISSLPQGIYIISIIADGKKSNRMFTKQ